MKIGFYIENRGLLDIDMSQPNLGNPGVGGTQYCFLLLIYYLKKFKPQWDLIIFCNISSIYPHDTEYIIVDGYRMAICEATKTKCDYLVIKADYDLNLINAISAGHQKIIMWGHNYYLSPLADFIAQNSNVVANVFVGKQQYDRYIDHDIITKSIVINNMLNDPFPKFKRDEVSPIVVYMGAIIPAKGFHLLAKIWKDILRKCPYAKLKVLGSGNLYSRQGKLGPLGIADKQYEDIFLPYLSDERGALLPSVEFCGVLGKEKYDIFKNSSVGVVNPSARTETFGMGVIEMAFCQLPVVTLGINGHPDTVIDNETGILATNLSGIRRAIIKLLLDEEQNNALGKNAKVNSARFSPQRIIPLWINLFESLERNDCSKVFSCSGISKPYSNNYKWLRWINSFFRFKLGLRFLPSILTVESYFYRKISAIRNF